MRRLLLLVSLATLVATFGVGPTANSADEMEDVAVILPTQIKWKDGPASLPAGAKIALLEGDPSKEGPFIMRLRFPDGYRVMPHVHPKRERVTVISGVLNIGMGEKFDADKCRAMPAGSFGTWDAGMKHFAWIKGETVLQLQGVGPWEIKYLDPADDPRKAKK